MRESLRQWLPVGLLFAVVLALGFTVFNRGTSSGTAWTREKVTLEAVNVATTLSAKGAALLQIDYQNLSNCQAPAVRQAGMDVARYLEATSQTWELVHVPTDEASQAIWLTIVHEGRDQANTARRLAELGAEICAGNAEAGDEFDAVQDAFNNYVIRLKSLANQL